MQQRILHRNVSRKLFRDMDCDHDGKIDKFEFVSHMLTKLGLVQQQEVDNIVHRFNQLDVSGSGSIEAADLETTWEQVASRLRKKKEGV